MVWQARMYWISRQEAVIYQADRHIMSGGVFGQPIHPRLAAWKFLFWLRDGTCNYPLLIVGSKQLSDGHLELYEVAKQHLGDVVPTEDKPDAAGTIDDRGCIESWSSHHFKVETPINLQPLLMEALNVNN